MKDLYRKLVINRHLDVMERKLIGNEINHTILKQTVLELVSEFSSIPIDFQANTEKYLSWFDGYILNRETEGGLSVLEIREFSADRYKLQGKKEFQSLDSAIEFWLAHEIGSEIDGIPIKKSLFYK